MGSFYKKPSYTKTQTDSLIDSASSTLYLQVSTNDDMLTEVAAASAGWNSTETTVNTTSGNWNALERMKWENIWEEATYEENDVVRDGDWTMVANKQTSDRAAPQPIGSAVYDLTGTLPLSTAEFEGVVWTGAEYTLEAPGWINSVDVYVTELTDDTNHRVLLLNNDTSAVNIITNPILRENQWATVLINPTPFATGASLTVILDSLNSGSSTGFTGGWKRASNINTATINPGVSAWGTDNNERTLRINKIDANGTPRTTELLSLSAGTDVVIVDTGNNKKSVTWELQADPVEYAGPIGWDGGLYLGSGTQGQPTVGSQEFLLMLMVLE